MRSRSSRARPSRSRRRRRRWSSRRTPASWRASHSRAWADRLLSSVFAARYRRSRREKNALRALAGDPLAWTLPHAFDAPDARAPLTPSTREQLDALPKGFRAVVVLVDLEE